MTPIARAPVPETTRAPEGSTNAYVVGSDRALLVDPAGRTDELNELVFERRVEHVTVTHTHPDHTGAVRTYAEETGATVWCRRGREARFADATGVDPDRTFAEGDEIPVGDDGVTVLDTPGHAPDHVAFEGDFGVCCGDLAVAEGSVVVGAPEGSLRAYLVALRRLHARDPPALYPGHGPVIDDPRATCKRLIRHRLDRERSVLDAVGRGAADVDAVVDAAYEKDLTGVRDLARATVIAHLEKLASEGRLRYDADSQRVEPA
ncbi:zn-dependent hydrolase, glyoxylase [Halogeometricum pallidum JCM 14848]|uniref:Zn-dependent hydrolase, glyoxylase n=1 Tax=Halogeometricum pallidum JCM 14848 TaxID=1227487 RepID=M0CZA1_HALPD|nr:MBL fold metallo-hydrolase [Halogeometricum pallidum]ELZ27229.1 zn-dependent hydrolase, glyoxylase [Halogeometricum pallidum JCM 14848]